MEKTFGVRNEELLSPQLVLPIQFQRIWHGAKTLTPERLLALHVLWQAADDILKNKSARQRKRQQGVGTL